MQGAKRVLGELALVLLERGLDLGVPHLALLVRQILPNDLGERAVVGLDRGRDVLALDERGAEEDEGIGRTGDVVVRLLLCHGPGDEERGSRRSEGRASPRRRVQAPGAGY